MAVETLFLDAGGVLVFPNWRRVADTLRRHGVEADAAALAGAEAHAKREIDVGPTIQTTTDTQRGWLYFNRVLTHAGLSLDARTDAALTELRGYHNRVNLWETVPAEVHGALERFRSLGLRLVVLSNANGTLRAAFDRLELTRHFHLLFDSFEEGVEKPDPRLFRLALDRAGADAGTTLHVGDLYHVDVAGARAAGLQAILLDAAGLYCEYDCDRVGSLTELADRLQRRV